MNRDAGWITASLLTVAASFGFSALHPKPSGAVAASPSAIEAADASASTPKPGSKPPTRQPSPCDGLQDLLAHFLDVTAQTIHTPGSCNSDAQPVAKEAVPLPGHTHLSVIIATLPDPLHTAVPLMFDRGTEAIQQAAQDSNYIYDSAWLPWKTGRADTSKDVSDARLSALEAEPGVLLFRKSLESKPNSAAPPISPYGDGLIVFLVGEEATNGIHPAQFVHTAQWIASLRAQGILSDKNIQILGPTFTGSFPSLAQLLQEPDVHAAFLQGPDQKLEIFSGQVTGNKDVAWFQSQLKQPKIADLDILFQSFVQDDKTVLRRFYQYLIGIGLGTDRLAIISEDETAYGFSTREKINDIQTFYYPRDISAVRTAYQAQSLFSAPATASSADDGTPKTLKTDLTEPERKENDTVHSYAGSQSALSQEAVLLQIVSMLKSHQTEFILLRSSNPLDQLFLAHFFKLTYPDGRIIILGSDLLFRREMGSTGLNGVLSLSNYPALPDIDEWTTVNDPTPHDPASPVHRAFTQNGGEGTYIAMRALLRAPQCVLTPAPDGFLPEYCLSDERPPDYAEPFWLATPDNPHTPATWLTVLGNNGFWPVAALNDPTYNTTRPPSARRWPAPPLSMKVCLIAILLWSIFHAVCCCLPSITVKPEHRSYFARSGDHSHSATRSHIAILVASSVLVVVIAILVAWGYGWMDGFNAPIRSPRIYFTFPFVVWGIVAFGLVFNAWLEVHLNRPNAASFSIRKILHRSNWAVLARSAFRDACLPLFLFALCTVAFCIFFQWYIDSPLKPGVRTLSYLRSMDLTTGVSPVIPLVVLALGMYCWCWYSLRGLALFGLDKPVLPSNDSLSINFQQKDGTDATFVPGNEEKFLTMLSEENVSIPLEEYCRPFNRSTWKRFAAIFISLWLGAIFTAGRAPLRSLGSQRYADMVCVWIAFSIALLLANTWQFVHIWLRLRALLAFLDKLPLRRTLQAMHGFSWGSIWKLGGNVLDLRYQLFYRQFEALNHLQTSLEHVPQDSSLFSHRGDARTLAAQIEETRSVRKAFAAWYAMHWDEWTARDLSTLCAVQASEAKIVGTLISRLLVPVWQNEGISLLLGDGQAEAGRAAQISLHPEQYVRNAEEIVCLLYLGFIQNILGRLRSLVIGMVCLFLSIALVLPSYPFDPRPVLTGAVIILFLIVGVVVFMVYSQMFRDATLSHLTDTKPGELGSQFWIKFATVGVGPLIGLIATVFPGISQFLLSWLQPSLSAMK
jgi:hypothetical protein